MSETPEHPSTYDAFDCVFLIRHGQSRRIAVCDGHSDGSSPVYVEVAGMDNFPHFGERMFFVSVNCSGMLSCIRVTDDEHPAVLLFDPGMVFVCPTGIFVEVQHMTHEQLYLLGYRDVVQGPWVTRGAPGDETFLITGNAHWHRYVKLAEMQAIDLLLSRIHPTYFPDFPKMQLLKQYIRSAVHILTLTS